LEKAKSEGKEGALKKKKDFGSCWERGGWENFHSNFATNFTTVFANFVVLQFT